MGIYQPQWEYEGVDNLELFGLDYLDIRQPQTVAKWHVNVILFNTWRHIELDSQSNN